ncbi:hypothetical protein D3C76_1442010 [compost metagenome]
MAPVRDTVSVFGLVANFIDGVVMLVFFEDHLQQITRRCGEEGVVDSGGLTIIIGEGVVVAEVEAFAHHQQHGQLARCQGAERFVDVCVEHGRSLAAISRQ